MARTNARLLIAYMMTGIHGFTRFAIRRPRGRVYVPGVRWARSGAVLCTGEGVCGCCWREEEAWALRLLRGVAFSSISDSDSCRFGEGDSGKWTYRKGDWDCLWGEVDIAGWAGEDKERRLSVREGPERRPGGVSVSIV